MGSAYLMLKIQRRKRKAGGRERRGEDCLGKKGPRVDFRSLKGEVQGVWKAREENESVMCMTGEEENH